MERTNPPPGAAPAAPTRSLRVVGGAALALLLAAAAPTRAATGGPDAFGYTWKDSAEPGVSYAWQAPGAGAQDVTALGDDTTTGFLPLSFGFPYYGNAYTQLAVCSNGWLSLIDDVSTTFTNLSIPTVGEPRGVIAAWWNDLELSNRTSTVTLEDFGTHAIVTWDQAHDRGDTRARNTFQVILHDDGRLVVQLDDLGGEPDGSSLGIESPDESTGLQVFRNPVGGVTAPYRVEFSPPAVVGNDLDCAGAAALACNSRVVGDRTAGAANQSSYGCPTGAMGGAEQVWALDVAGPSDLRLSLENLGGEAELVVLDGCDPNRCLAPPGPVVELDGFSGSAIVVVDGPAGREGAYELLVDCFPVPGALDCASAVPLACGDAITADLATGRADQSRYWCTPDDLDGREHVYRIDLAAPTSLRIDLEAVSGAPRLLLLRPCDPNFCTQPVGDTVQIDADSGSWFLVVDSPAGSEGAYQLTVTCLEEEFGFCTDGLYRSRAGLDSNGSWTVPSMLYDGVDTHNWALRVDGGTIYTQDETCTTFPFVSSGTLGPDGPGVVTWEAPEGRVDVTVSELQTGTCCGLLVTAEVTNTDSVPHAYELRVLHDLAFGLGTGGCPLGDDVNGGPIVVDGRQYTREQELLDLGADLCDRPVELYSADDPATLVGSVEMFGETPPADMEFVSWESAWNPCLGWNDLLTGANLGDCFGDSSLLLLWELPAGGGALAPGERAVVRWRLGDGCTFDCTPPCEDPVLDGPGTAADPDPCTRGLQLDWSPAVFPDAGNGVYHVHRSTVSHAEALARPPVTPAGGVAAPSWLDASAPTGVPVYHVVVAESLDLAGCGEGPAAAGSTASLELGPSVDETAFVPALVDASASDLEACAPDVELDWSEASFSPAGGVYHLHRSTASFADALLQPPITPPAGLDAPGWVDAAPPANVPLHYVLVAEDLGAPGCGDGPSVAGTTDRLEIGPVTDAAAEPPVLGTGSVADPDACTQGLELAWEPAAFPGASAGRYHLYRSTVSFADALASAPITPAGGLEAPGWSDASAPLGVPLFYVVQAEAIDLPGCGGGPFVAGTTDELELGPQTDLGSAAPALGAATAADDDGCLAGVSLSWDPVAWPSPADGGVHHVYRSTLSHADALASGPVSPPGGIAGTSWADPAPPANRPLYYVLQAESFERAGCGAGPVIGGLTDELELRPVTDAVSAEPVAGGGTAIDEDPCAAGGLLVAWDAVAFPGPGNGRYHVHRSELSAADALLLPPLTPAGGIVSSAYLDDTASPGTTWHYAVVAESTDFPGCGDGPSVGGPTTSVDCGSAEDLAAPAPPGGRVGAVLRLAAGGPDSVRLDWAGSDAPTPGEEWAVLRSDDEPSAGFVVETRLGLQSWTDAASASPAGPPHVWYYDVRLIDDCNQVSED